MNYDQFEEKMLSLFTETPNSMYDNVRLTIAINSDLKSCDITYKAMYENPVKNLFEFGLELVELFGTKKIDFDNQSYGGCETCDYGSSYEQEFYIKEITKNFDNLNKFVENYGKNVYSKKR